MKKIITFVILMTLFFAQTISAQLIPESAQKNEPRELNPLENFFVNHWFALLVASIGIIGLIIRNRQIQKREKEKYEAGQLKIHEDGVARNKKFLSGKVMPELNTSHVCIFCSKSFRPYETQSEFKGFLKFTMSRNYGAFEAKCPNLECGKMTLFMEEVTNEDGKYPQIYIDGITPDQMYQGPVLRKLHGLSY